MISLELVLHPDFSPTLDSEHSPLVPKHLHDLIVSLEKRYDIRVCSYDSPATTSFSNIRLYYFSQQQQFDTGAFIAHALENNMTDRQRNLAIVDFPLADNSPSSIVFFNDIVFLHTDIEHCLSLVFSHIESSCDNTDTISQRVADAFYQLSFVGISKAYKTVVRSICKMAECQAPLLLEGETGTGKELLARAAHHLGNNNRFVPINCAAIPDALFESELFGHEKGAFTNAQQKKQGLVEMAEGGTLFLDEVNSLSDKAQSCLLRFLQTGEFRSVGSNQLKQARLRIISATNVPLEDEVNAGKVRMDLMYRLNVLNLKIPPLRERLVDIEIIANHLLQSFEHKYQQGKKILHPSTIKWLKAQLWPGNVRELENLLLREYLLEKTAIIKLHEKDENIEQDLDLIVGTELEDKLTELKFCEAKTVVVDQFAAHYVKAMLIKTSGNITRAAKLSGKERRAFGRLVKKYKIAI
jgi:transcriptional regulator with PAS, ATPase and Fis domain